MTDGELKALRVVKAYVRDKGYDVGADEDNECLIYITKGHCHVADMTYDSPMGVLTITKAAGKPRSLFLYHPTILMLLDTMFDPPPPVCDPDR